MCVLLGGMRNLAVAFVVEQTILLGIVSTMTGALISVVLPFSLPFHLSPLVLLLVCKP